MIHAYSAPTPNGHKLHVMLEECALDYALHRIDFGAGDQFKPDFMEISPNNKIPVMVVEDGPGDAPVSIFESGALMIYLAEKTGTFLPHPTAEPRGRMPAHEWP